jgi:hypothetical protein
VYWTAKGGAPHWQKLDTYPSQEMAERVAHAAFPEATHQKSVVPAGELPAGAEYQGDHR